MQNFEFHKLDNQPKFTQYSYGKYIITIVEKIEKGGTEIAECYINKSYDGIVRHVVGVVKYNNLDWLQTLIMAAFEHIEYLESEER